MVNFKDNQPIYTEDQLVSQNSKWLAEAIREGVVSGVSSRQLQADGFGAFDEKTEVTFLRPDSKKLWRNICIFADAVTAASILGKVISQAEVRVFFKDLVLSQGVSAINPTTGNKYDNGWESFRNGVLTHPAISWFLEKKNLESISFYKIAGNGLGLGWLLNTVKSKNPKSRIIPLISVDTQKFLQLNGGKFEVIAMNPDGETEKFIAESGTHVITILNFNKQRREILIFDPLKRVGVDVIRTYKISELDQVISGVGILVSDKEINFPEENTSPHTSINPDHPDIS